MRPSSETGDIRSGGDPRAALGKLDLAGSTPRARQAWRRRLCDAGSVRRRAWRSRRERRSRRAAWASGKEGLPSADLAPPCRGVDLVEEVVTTTPTAHGVGEVEAAAGARDVERRPTTVHATRMRLSNPEVQIAQFEKLKKPSLYQLVDFSSKEMDSESSRYDKLESMLQDGSSEPRNLPLQYLRNITDNFSDERLLGEGGFGTVYKGVLSNGETIAVKKLNSSMPGVKDMHFDNEASNLTRLKHPNVVLLVGWCYETENIYVEYNGKYICAEKSERLLCLEYMPNGSLREFLSDEASGLGWDIRHKIIEGICYGLHYLHEEWQDNVPLVHMDLKPANILLDNNMVPKIADFGLSRLFDETKTWTCTISRDGTLGYMAPEYINRGLISTKSDIFSLGVIILEIVTGHRDYPDETGIPSQEFIELVLKNWRNRLQKSECYTSLETYCEQIMRCTQIGLVCVHHDQSKRPTTRQIIVMLHNFLNKQIYVHMYPPPAIEGLQITGEAFPGRELQASGYTINGTTSCNFEWVRHLDDGSVNFIEGARQPTYLVSADDVDSVLAIEVQPLDDRKRKGEIVKVYADDQRKITCDHETKELIKKVLSMGHVSYEVLLSVRFLDMWEPAVLAIKREGYSIKGNGKHGVVVTEKFQQAMTINIPYGRPTEFLISSADGAEYNLKPAENAPSRDAIVLVLRLFKMEAVQKSKGRRKGIFFK
ncbi:hypothetical protein U9M48_027239 [Paspalum notatum var. saurae]|uniref:Protein kinase domain-containing protein n=1 Tax=Paspalum notatum var. saurae TaxID=547442 RepID=A0AAQ3WZX5_PASNO